MKIRYFSTLLFITCFFSSSMNAFSSEIGEHKANIEILYKNAHKDNPKAQFELAQFLAIEQNKDPEAISWYQKAADQNYAPAMDKLAFYYDHGYRYTYWDHYFKYKQEIEKDDVKALHWFNLAANQGNYSAVQILIDKEAPNNFIQKNQYFQDIANTIQQKAKNNETEALIILAGFYQDGYGAPSGDCS